MRIKKTDPYREYKSRMKDKMKLKRLIESVPYFKYDPYYDRVINLETGRTISIPYALRIAKAYKKYKGYVPKAFATGHKKRLYEKAYKELLKGNEEMEVSVLKPQYQYTEREVRSGMITLPHGKKYKKVVVKVRTRKWAGRLWREEGTIKGFVFEEKRYEPVKPFFERYVPETRFVREPVPVQERVVREKPEVILHRLNRAGDKAFNILIIPLNITYSRMGLYGDGWKHYVWKRQTEIEPMLWNFIRKYGHEMRRWTVYYRVHGMVYSDNYGDYEIHMTSPYQVPLNREGIEALLDELDKSVLKIFGKAGMYTYVVLSHVTFYFNTSGLPLTEEQKSWSRAGVYGF